MHCFYHRDSPALGVCKSCGRGVCGECAVEYEEGLACRGRCERAVNELIAMIGRTRRAVVRSGRAVYLFPSFFVILGLVFIVAGTRDGRSLGVILGSVFLVLGLAHAWSVRRIHRGA